MFLALVWLFVAFVVGCGGSVEPGPRHEPTSDAGPDASSREQCDYSEFDCIPADFGPCREALAKQSCSDPIPDACKPCVRL